MIYWIKTKDKKPTKSQIVLACQLGQKEPPFTCNYDYESDSFILLSTHQKVKICVDFWTPMPSLPWDTLKNLVLPITDVDLSVRTMNVLVLNRIEYVAELVTLTPRYLLELRNLGKRSLREISTTLEDMGLCLGMHLPMFGFDDEDLTEQIRKKANEWEKTKRPI